jgi:SDR family mycofactocin-dependent oxidoreductase
VTPSRVALVTGAARGIGAAVVDALVLRGYHVVAVDSCAGARERGALGYDLATPEQLAAVADRHPDRVLAIAADVRDQPALATAVRVTVERFGRLDAAVAAAAVITGGRPQWQVPEAELRHLLDVNLVGVWHTAAVAVPVMLSAPEPRGGRFVAISSAAGVNGLYGLSAYSAAKHAVVGLVRALAEDLVGTGVTAVAVAPGSTRTDMLDASARLYGLQDVGSFAGSSLNRRIQEPHEVAEVVAFCCSAEAGPLNASVVHADGGFRP